MFSERDTGYLRSTAFSTAIHQGLFGVNVSSYLPQPVPGALEQAIFVQGNKDEIPFPSLENRRID
jgi:hypothetical protein